MPRGNNSYMSDSDGSFWKYPTVAAGEPTSSAYGITEPGCGYAIGGQTDSADDLPAVLAKEPDRQTTTRRGSSSRGRMDSDFDEEQGSSRMRNQRGSNRGAQARRGSQSQARRSGSTASRQKKSRRGFAAMSPEQQREIARKGGLTVSRNRRHMADIGRVGGEHSHGGRRARARR